MRTNFQGTYFLMTNIYIGFIFEDHLLSAFVFHMHCDSFKNLIFVDDKLPAKTAKITSLKNLHII